VLVVLMLACRRSFWRRRFRATRSGHGATKIHRLARSLGRRRKARARATPLDDTSARHIEIERGGSFLPGCSQRSAALVAVFVGDVGGGFFDGRRRRPRVGTISNYQRIHHHDVVADHEPAFRGYHTVTAVGLQASFRGVARRGVEEGDRAFAYGLSPK